jgi:alpha-N-arabinofuranosidase
MERIAMKKITVLAASVVFLSLNLRAQVHKDTVVLDASYLKYKISKNIYGQFSEHLGHCIYGGIWVGESSKIPNTRGIRNDVVAALKEIKVPVVRWPGGCFADEYHWKNGIGPRDKRPSMINTNWGGVTEDNSFGTHEFLDFCGQVGCEPYITGNVGSGTVQEFSQWVEYVNSDNVSPMTEMRKANGRDSSWGVKYWGIGNESWGCGGNMRPEYYADQVRRYGTYMRNYGKNRLFKIACGPSGDDYQWTEVLMKNAVGHMQGLSLHHYAFGDRKPAADFDESGWYDIMDKTLAIERYIDRHCAIMDKYDPNKKVALVVDEWGTWYGVEPGTNPGFLYQQNTMRDAVAAACNLNIFNNHCDRIRMANIAQMVNVLQAMILTDGGKMVLTPTYYVFDLFKVHQDAMLVKSNVKSADYVFEGKKLPAVNCSASIGEDGRLNISLCNIDPKSRQTASCEIKRFKPTKGTGQILTADAMNADNTFDRPDAVHPKQFSDFRIDGQSVTVNLPPMAVAVLELEGKHELPPALEVKNPKPGVECKYFEGQWEQLPNFGTLSPKRTEVVKQFVIPESNSGENFGTQYEGYIKLPADGLYTFSASSDDGTDLSVDDNLVVDNDGRHAPEEQSGTVLLKAGFHRIKVDFFQAGGGKVLEVRIEGPGVPRQIIPPSMLFH